MPEDQIAEIVIFIYIIICDDQSIMLCKSSIGLRLAITNEDAEDSAESSTDEEEEAAGEEERLVSLNSISTDFSLFTCIDL